MSTSQKGYHMQDLDVAEYSGVHVSRYSTTKLFGYGFVNPKGSVFTWSILIRTIVLALIATGMAVRSCPTNKPNNEYAFCFPILSSTEGLIFASLVAFLLGMFQTSTFARWWSVREKLGVVMNNITYSAMVLANFSTADEEAKSQAQKITRLMNAAHSLIYKQACKENELDTLVEKQLLTQEEKEALDEVGRSHSNLAAVIFNWCVASLKDMCSQNKLPSTVFIPILNSINASFLAMQDLFAFLETQLPYAYLHMLTLVTKIHIIFVMAYSAGIISQGITTASWTRIVFGYSVIFFNQLIYEGLLYIHDMVVNPLGDESGDFPKHLYMEKTAGLTDIIHHGLRRRNATITVSTK